MCHLYSYVCDDDVVIGDSVSNTALFHAFFYFIYSVRGLSLGSTLTGKTEKHIISRFYYKIKYF